MNGQHIPNTPVVVDYWRVKNVPPRSLFFLTHMHADHTSGLSSSWAHPIHCTPTTAKLLRRKFNIDPKLTVELEVGVSRLLRVNCPGEPVSITVTVLDANHCPGSAMFLFEGYFGSILYTGDFRFSPDMLSNPLLNGSRTIDILYLDNTYCHPSCNFPTREKATEAIVTLMEENLEMFVFLGLHTLGKEELLVTLARGLQTWVGVPRERYEMLKLLEMPDVFRTDEEMGECRIQVYPFHMVSKALLKELKSDSSVLGVLPTCIFVGNGAPKSPDSPIIRVIPYSDHSSYQELRQFVRSVRPRSVLPIVHKFSGDPEISARTNMSVFNDCLEHLPPVKYEIPSSIRPLLSMNSPGHSNTVTHPHPPMRKRISLRSSVNRQKRLRGVQFLSPSKSSSARHDLAMDTSAINSDDNQDETGCHAGNELVGRVDGSGNQDNILEITEGERSEVGIEKRGEGTESLSTTTKGRFLKAGTLSRESSNVSNANEYCSEEHTQLEQGHVQRVLSQLKVCNPTSCVMTASADGPALTGSHAYVEEEGTGLKDYKNDLITLGDDQQQLLVPEPSQRPPCSSEYSKLFGSANTSSGSKSSTRKLPLTVLPSSKPAETDSVRRQISEQPSIMDLFALEQQADRRYDTSDISLLALEGGGAQNVNEHALLTELRKQDLTSPAVQHILKAALELGTGGRLLPESSLNPLGSTSAHAATRLHAPENKLKQKLVGSCNRGMSDREQVANVSLQSLAVSKSRLKGKGKEKATVKRSRRDVECEDGSPVPKKLCSGLAGKSTVATSEAEPCQSIQECTCQADGDWVCSFGVDEFCLRASTTYEWLDNFDNSDVWL